MTKIIELPIIICGEIKMPGSDYIQIYYSKDVIVRIARATKDDLQKIYEFKEDLSKLTFPQVTQYIVDFANSFLDTENQTKQEALEVAPYVTGYAYEQLLRDYDVICSHFSKKYNIYDTVTAEFGTYRILDEWVTNLLAKVRAYPRGRAFHVLVGNVPLTGIYSVFRSIITKNQTVIKLPSRDLVSTLFFVKGLIEANNGHQDYQNLINRSLSVFYIEKESEDMKDLIESSDMVCAWGQGNSLKKIKEMVPHSIPYLEFGPKRSLALIYPEECDHDEAAIRMAHDLCCYDQEACLSPQRLFIKGDYKPFLIKLEKWLNWQSKYLPRGIINDDAESYLFRNQLEMRYKGFETMTGEPHWRIVVCDPFEIKNHPLGRTLFVHPIKDEKEVIPFIDDETQCISVYPYVDGEMEKIGDLFCSNGTSKICETGMSFYPREGWTHDAMYALHYFVRLCYLDSSSFKEYKYDPDPEEGIKEVMRMFHVSEEELGPLGEVYKFG